MANKQIGTFASTRLAHYLPPNDIYSVESYYNPIGH